MSVFTNNLKYGIFGGGFNPPHMAHVLGAAYVQAKYQFDYLYVSPCWGHPFEDKDPLVNWSDRAQMCELAFSGIQGVRVRYWEHQIKSPYTVNVLEQVIPRLEGTPHLIVGSDNIDAKGKWHRWDRVVELVQGNIICLPRGTGILPNISSTEIRDTLKTLGSQTPAIEPFVPLKVLQYIREHGLYV